MVGPEDGWAPPRDRPVGKPSGPLSRRARTLSLSPRPLRAARWLPIGLVLTILLVGNVPVQASAPVTAHAASWGGLGGLPMRSIPDAGAAPVNATLTVNASSVNLSSQFWGTTVNNEVRMFRGESDAVNGTPAKVLVWPGAMAGEDYDPFTDTHYDTYNGTGKHALTSEVQFVEMCKAINCTAIVQVPAEIDDPNFAERIVNYTEVNLSFHPAYWMIGNEPELWQHWKEPWKEWATQYSGGPDPTQFGEEVLAYVKAIRNVDNTTPILGLPASGCTCGSWTFEQWISGVLKVTGPKIQAVAFHEYPAGWLGTGDGSLFDFYGTIQSAANIPIRMAGARQAVLSSCPGCNVSVFISELGAALSWSAYGQYAIGFSGPLSIASQITQAMDVNLSNIDLFATELATTNSWFSPNGSARADYALYTQIFDHLGTEAFPVDLSGLGHTLYGIDTVAPNDQGRQDLLVMNDNITHAVAFAPQFAHASLGAPAEAWSWNGSIHSSHANGTTWVEPYTPNPVPQELPDGLPATYVLPPQSMVLFEAYPTGASYVRILENGVPAPTPWYASVGSRLYTTTAGNISLLVPPGSYPIGSVPIPLPIGGRELNPAEHLAAFGASPLVVSGTSTNTTLDFVPQWRVNVSASPSVGGTVQPGVGWWNVSQALNVTATPNLGYAFVGWSGWGPGSYNGSGRTATLAPTGRVFEKARFVVGNEVDLRESGLPIGTPWSVSVRGFTTNSSTDYITLYEPNGTWGFQVQPIPGYRLLPRNGSFTVDHTWSLFEIQFIRLTPPPTPYAVTFTVSGLPVSTPVSITVRDATLTAGTLDPQFLLLNGSYAYHVGYVPGFHANVPLKMFWVQGGPVTVDVPFVPTVYPVVWDATGSRSGMNWTVDLDGTSMVADSAWVATSLPNGSYSYALQVPANFSVSPRTGVVAVDGFGMRLAVSMNLMEYTAAFEALGPSAPNGWSVRLGSLTQGADANLSSFSAANGTYTFDVRAPAGYYAVPSHGNLTVAGPPPPTMIRFHLSSEKPSAALVAALSSGALGVALWIGVSFFVGFVVVRRLRRRAGRSR
jgi:hypothetical protein